MTRKTTSKSKSVKKRKTAKKSTAKTGRAKRKPLTGLSREKDLSRRINKSVNEIKKDLKKISTGLERYTKLKEPTWGHIGDLNYITYCVNDLKDFVLQKGKHKK